MLLVDTSVWIELFRRPPGLAPSRLDLDEVVTCLPVLQEVLQGFDDEGAFRLAREAMEALPIVDSPLPAERYSEAVDLYRAARRAGLTVRSGIACLVAACALRHDLTVAHRDRDYDALTRVSPLKVRRL